jgi:hypothetical protein
MSETIALCPSCTALAISAGEVFRVEPGPDGLPQISTRLCTPCAVNAASMLNRLGLLRMPAAAQPPQ